MPPEAAGVAGTDDGAMPVVGVGPSGRDDENPAIAVGLEMPAQTLAGLGFWLHRADR